MEITSAGYELRPSTRGIGASIGTSVHLAASVVLGEKAKTGVLPPLDIATDAARDTLKEEIALGTQFDQRITPNAQDAQQQVIRMTRSYHGKVAPQINAILVEERLEASVPWSTENIIISGQPDVVAREPGMIDDLKSGSRLGYHLPQIGSYSLVVRSHNITDITAGRITWVPRVTMKKPQPEPVNQEINIAKAESIAVNVLKHIDQAVHVWRHGDEERGIHPGDPAAFLSNPSSMLCSARWCRAHSCGSRGWCSDWQSNVGDDG